ncbi:MAG: response regulator [Butyrivibrio sp.]|uniref:response regulator n=1 Tax=Butyrivibrio sp. TaxID=28121 RepID=UPI001B4C8F94|nr:response regulator [Butyrivibrio sp.]MBP3783524.1 response regulator [Butyrivibrio sp.]
MLGFEKYKKSSVIIATLVGTVTFIMLALCCIYSAVYGANMHISTGGVVIITFFILPYLILGGLYGYLISLIVFFISFICALIFNTSDAYKMSIFLVATLSFSLFGQYFWFATKKKTAIVALVTLVATSFTELLCISVIESNEYALYQMKNVGTYFVRDVLVIFIAAFLFHIYYTKAPDSWKYPFPIAVAYTGYYQNDKELSRQLRKTKVSYKITAIIIGMELLLGIFVGIFMVVLFPDIKDMFVAGINPLANSGSEVSIEEMRQHIERMNYIFSGNAISYDIKMVLLIMCVGVPVAAIANFYTKTTIGAPLGNMSDFMLEYAQADDEKKLEVGQKVDDICIKTHDEIQVVHESIQATVHAIEEYIAHINEEHELEKELEVAQKASEAKSSFLSNMSHEIRTPINAVLGLNEMIIRESHEEQILEYATSVKSAGNSLLGIVNDILDFSKIEAGKMDILPVEYNISSTINDLLNLVAVKAEDKGLALNFNIDETIPQKLIGDEVRIKQCVTNILTNAVKYTEKGSVDLNVSCRKADEDSIYLRFEIVDTGIGIKEEDLEKLYSPFERIEEIRNRSIEGTGLGMSIVKKLLALMDTRLEVKSVYGEGSNFSFEVKQQVASWEELGDFRERYKEFLGSQKKYSESFVAPDALILIVDDTPINLTVVKGLLKKTKIQVDTAESGFETLELVKKKRYDAIFIDHRMPEMDGIQTLKALKEMEDNLSKDAPCIALTANAGAGAREEYIAEGFNDYLSKPVNGELLEQMLIEYLPKEKVLEVDTAVLADGNGEETSDSAQKDVLRLLQGIDLHEAEKNCGSREVLKNVVKEFLTTIDTKAEQIEGFVSEGDWRNYTVTVHALKSSARLIGAMELSGMAAHLEDCGNKEDEKEIREKTPELLELFRSYNEKLSAINGNVSEDELPEIGPDELESAFGDMKELLEAYDFDTADGIMEMLSDYRIPEEYKEKYEKVKTLMSAVDRDELLKIL